jgi:hypothetical protein
MSGTGVQEAVAVLRAAYDTLAARDLDALTVPDLLTLGDELEALACQLPTQFHRVLARRATPAATTKPRHVPLRPPRKAT